MVTDLGQAIRQHTKELQELQTQIDNVDRAVETETNKARKTLKVYRQRKIESFKLLVAAGRQYQRAEAILAGTGKLLTALRGIKAEHVTLSQAAIRRADRAAITEMRHARRQLKKMYEQIRLLQAQSAPAEPFENCKSRG